MSGARTSHQKPAGRPSPNTILSQDQPEVRRPTRIRSFGHPQAGFCGRFHIMSQIMHLVGPSSFELHRELLDRIEAHLIGPEDPGNPPLANTMTRSQIDKSSGISELASSTEMPVSASCPIRS